MKLISLLQVMYVLREMWSRLAAVKIDHYVLSVVDVRVIVAPYTNTVCHVVSILTSSRCYAAY